MPRLLLLQQLLQYRTLLLSNLTSSLNTTGIKMLHLYSLLSKLSEIKNWQSEQKLTSLKTRLVYHGMTKVLLLHFLMSSIQSYARHILSVRNLSSNYINRLKMLTGQVQKQEREDSFRMLFQSLSILLTLPNRLRHMLQAKTGTKLTKTLKRTQKQKSQKEKLP